MTKINERNQYGCMNNAVISTSDPHLDLLAAIVRYAVLDSTIEVDKDKLAAESVETHAQNRNEERKLECRKSARAFLFGDSGALEYYCDLCNCSADYIRRTAKIVIAKRLRRRKKSKNAKI